MSSDSLTVGGINVEFTPTSRDFDGVWAPFKPSTQVLPKGWQREPGFRALPADIIWEKDVAIPLRDGTIIRGDIFRPAELEGTRLPTILPWSPYGKTDSGSYHTVDMNVGISRAQLSGLEKFEAPDPAEWCPRGYAVANVDAPGAFESQGNLIEVGTQEGRNGYDTIDWISKQPWSNGAVGMAGNSWLGIAQWMVAAEKPPALKAIAPWEAMSDFYRQNVGLGGIPHTHFWELIQGIMYGHNKQEDIIGMLKKYPLTNAYWDDKRAQFDKINIPMYVLASYSSMFHTEGSIRGYLYASSQNKWLRVHPTQEWHDLYQPASNDDLQKFFDRYLVGKQNDWEATPKVRLSLLRFNGPPILNRAESDYPPARVEYKEFYLDGRSNKILAGALPSDISITSYQSDSWDDNGVHFTWTFDKYTELVGYSKATIYVSTKDSDDMDVYVVIRKLDSAGNLLVNYNIPLKDMPPGTTESDIPNENLHKHVGPQGRLRASLRKVLAEDPGIPVEARHKRSPAEVYHPYDTEEKIPPGEVVELQISLWPTGIVFHPGETLRFEVKGHESNYPEFQPLYRKPTNLNRGKHSLYTGGNYKSRLLLPLIQ